MSRSLMMALLKNGGLMGGNSHYITYLNGNDTKVRESDIKAEYELIKQKKSTLPSNVRKAIVRYVESNKSHILGLEKK